MSRRMRSFVLFLARSAGNNLDPKIDPQQCSPRAPPPPDLCFHPPDHRREDIHPVIFSLGQVSYGLQYEGLSRWNGFSGNENSCSVCSEESLQHPFFWFFGRSCYCFQWFRMFIHRHAPPKSPVNLTYVICLNQKYLPWKAKTISLDDIVFIFR